jgi:hypothetical protein
MGKGRRGRQGRQKEGEEIVTYIIGYKNYIITHTHTAFGNGKKG